MKKLLAVIILFFVSNLTFAQDVSVCKKIVLQTYEAINKRSSKPIMKHLADDFSMAGQKGEIAKMILPQLFGQLNTKITKIKKISEKKTSVLTFVYESNFDGMGLIKSTFVFDKNNKLKKLDLIPMQAITN